MRRFHFERDVDESGVSGTGRVAEGIVFGNGLVAVCWLSDKPSVTTYLSFDDMKKIHSHDGKTRFIWDDVSHLKHKNEIYG